MNLEDLLSDVREKHLSAFGQTINEMLEERDDVYTEVLTKDEDAEPLCIYNRVDAIIGEESLDPNSIFTSEEGLLGFEAFDIDYETEDGQAIKIHFNPFGWDCCSFKGNIDKEKLTESATEWMDKWLISENDAESEDGLEHKIHSISFVKDDDNNSEYLFVDFGSADTDAFYEFLGVLLESGVSEVEIFS